MLSGTERLPFDGFDEYPLGEFPPFLCEQATPSADRVRLFLSADAGVDSSKVSLIANKAFTREFGLECEGKKAVHSSGHHVVLDRIEYSNIFYHSDMLVAQEN